MRTAVIAIIATSTYAFLGICPMQVDMMSGNMDMSNDMPMEHMMTADMHHHTMITKNTCNTCMQSIEQFLLKKSKTDEGMIVTIISHSAITPVYTAIEYIHNISPNFARGEPLSPHKHLSTVVLRT